MTVEYSAALSSEGQTALCRTCRNPCTKRGLLTWVGKRTGPLGILRLFVECSYF